MVLEEAINCFPLPKQAEARRGFNIALTAAANKVQKYLNLMPFAKATRVVDPRQRTVLAAEEGMGNQVESYQCLFKKGECIDALKA